jgi:O-antigen/teichoic acid export membrane protein
VNTPYWFGKYFRNTAWLLAERIIRLGIAFFVGVYVIRYLGPEDYGKISYVLSFVGLFAAISSLGLDSIVVRNLVNNPENRDELLGTSFILKLFGILFSWVIIAATVSFMNNDHEINIYIIIIISAFVFQCFNVIDYNYQATVQSVFVVQAYFVQIILSSIIKVTLVVNEAPLIFFVLVVIVDATVIALVLILNYLRKTGSLLDWRWSSSCAKKLLKDSWPLILSGAAITIYMQIDQVMIKEILGYEAVGNYSVAVRLSELWYFIPMAITSSLFPAILEAKNKSNSLYLDRMQNLYDILVILAVAIAIPVTFFSDEIIFYIFGGEYGGSSSVLVIHIWAGIFVFLNNASWKWYIAENLQKIANYRLYVGLIINVLLNYFLIPIYGITGAAVATVLSRALSSYIGNIFLRKTRPLFFQQTKALFVFFDLKRVFK